MSRVAAEFSDKFEEIAHLPLEKQAVWLLNGFWHKLEPEAEKFWEWVKLMKKLDINADPETVCDVDEFWSHKFLEELGETLTVIKLREKLREIDLNMDKRMCLIEYAMFKYDLGVEAVVKAPQADNAAELAEAQAKVDAAQEACNEAQKKLDESNAAAEAARVAEEENKAALAELKAQEEAYAAKIAELEKKSEEGGLVSRNRAKNELAQVRAEDPLPLRRAKLNSEAAVRKSEKATKAAEEALAASEAAYQAAADRLNEAIAFLTEVSQRGSGGKGAIWWMERNIKEMKATLPRHKLKQLGLL